MVIIFKVLKKVVSRKWYQLEKKVYIKVPNFLWRNSIPCVMWCNAKNRRLRYLQLVGKLAIVWKVKAILSFF